MEHPRPGADVTLTVALLDEPLTRPVLDGTTLPAGLKITPRKAVSVDANSRAMQDLAFDVAEMSFATFLRARLVERAPLIALPVFTGRRFVQPLIGVAPGSPLQDIYDLPGRRVAVPQYWMTSSVWHRAVLHDYYGISASDVNWVTTADERFDLQAAGVHVERCADGRTPTDLVLSGDADVVLSPRPPSGGLRPLFADPVAEQSRYHGATGVFPIMHLVVVREHVLSERPEDVAALWQALIDARDIGHPGAAVLDSGRKGYPTTLGHDVWTYGIDVNRTTLDALFRGVTRDGLIPHVPEPSDVFVPNAVLLEHDGSTPTTKGAT